MCRDALFKADYWWATAIGWTFLALMGAAVALGLVTKTNYGPFSAAGAFGVLLVCSCGPGIQLGLWVASAALLLSMLVSLVLHKVSRRFNAVRVTVVLLAMGLGVVRSLPENRSTRELLQVAVYVKKFPQKPSWLYPELLARADTREQLERQLMYEKKGNPNAIELHRELGFPAEVRRDACHTLRPEERTKACPGE